MTFHLKEWFLSDGFQVEEIDGHSFKDIREVIQHKSTAHALITLATAIRERGIDVMEGDSKSLYAKIASAQAGKLKKWVKYQNDKYCSN